MQVGQPLLHWCQVGLPMNARLRTSLGLLRAKLGTPFNPEVPWACSSWPTAWRKLVSSPPAKLLQPPNAVCLMQTELPPITVGTEVACPLS